MNDILDRIRKRPCLYIGIKSIYNLQSFLDGYYIARRDLNLPVDESEKRYVDFVKYLRYYFESESCELWSSLLVNFTKNETSAIDEFFRLYDQFVQSNVSFE